jgi:hypothetical protein
MFQRKRSFGGKSKKVKLTSEMDEEMIVSLNETLSSGSYGNIGGLNRLHDCVWHSFNGLAKSRKIATSIQSDSTK